MIILGISPLDADATISVVQDGKVLFAAAEERFTRWKSQDGFPAAALHAGLENTGIHPEDIDVVAYPFFEWERETELAAQSLRREKDCVAELPVGDSDRWVRSASRKIPIRTHPIAGLGHANELTERSLLHRMFYRLVGVEGRASRRIATYRSRRWHRQLRTGHQWWQRTLIQQLAPLGLLDKIKRCDHHLAHAANAYFASEFDRALAITLDGYGSGSAGSISVCEGNRIQRIHTLQYPHSLGTLYESVTSSLGLQPCRDEGKVVGLAAHGNPNVLLDLVLGRFHQSPGDFQIRESNNVYFSRYLATRYARIDVAAAFQRALELVATNYVRHYVQRTGIDTVVLSGGVTANVKLNQRIFEIPEVRRIFVYPNMGDGGTGTGAAFLASRGLPRGQEGYQTVYFGPAYSEAEIVRELQTAKLAFERVVPIEPIIARLLHHGNVVARFNGRMEYGPRALGNRSILYRATDVDANHWLNQQLGRTEFMPFAPVTLFEERHRCYENAGGAEAAAQFMTITFDCTDLMKSTSPAAVHVDGTARPQLLRREFNPSFYRIVREYYQLSGIASIINTSFNVHEEPIVNSPADAIQTFLRAHLDYLAIGDLLVPHPTRRDRASSVRGQWKNHGTIP